MALPSAATLRPRATRRLGLQPGPSSFCAVQSTSTIPRESSPLLGRSLDVRISPDLGDRQQARTASTLPTVAAVSSTAASALRTRPADTTAFTTSAVRTLRADRIWRHEGVLRRARGALQVSRQPLQGFGTHLSMTRTEGADRWSARAPESRGTRI